ncbi:MAG: hypothetical protein DYG89_32335 [Caldilinea sp. CFX5]|nr:hypothetical protein [Caldilinea sp. CFX5]
MQTNGISWRIGCNFPNELLLWGYIAQQTGFTLGEEPPRSAVEHAWRTWWERFLPITGVEEKISLFQPPNFPNLADTPGLQQVCQQVYPTFHRRWGHVDGLPLVRSVNQKLSTQLRYLNLNQLIKDWGNAQGRTTIHPFQLQINFVWWPVDYYREVTENQLVLGFQYLEPVQADAFKAIVQERIHRLA